MSFNENITLQELERTIQQKARALVNSILDAEELFKDLSQAGIYSQNVFARTLYSLPDTGKRVLSVDATNKQITCLAGANFFASFLVGRQINISGFVNAGNNSVDSDLITAKTNDSITLGNSTTLVNETDVDGARIKTNSFQDEKDIVNAAQATLTAMNEIFNFANNGASPVQGDRLALLRDFT